MAIGLSEKAANVQLSRCRICHSSDFRTFSANGFTWQKCFRCQCIQKRLSFGEYLALNPSYDPGHYLDSRSGDEIAEYLDVKGKVFLISDVLKRFCRDAQSRKSFLDVGCGMGGYLIAALSLDFEVLGFEPSKDHARIAREVLELPVIDDYFTLDVLGGRQFDFIMLSHVIEHIYDPREFILTLLKALKSGGLLVIVTPNSRSLSAECTGKHWVMLKPIDHVSMIDADAYNYFDLPNDINIQHFWSEFPWEFMATCLSSIRDWVRSQHREPRSDLGARVTVSHVASPLRVGGMRTMMLKGLLTILSFPFHVIAKLTGRQACLITVLARK